MFYSQVFTCSDPHADRCSNPLPWDPLSSPSRVVHCLSRVVIRQLKQVLTDRIRDVTCATGMKLLSLFRRIPRVSPSSQELQPPSLGPPLVHLKKQDPECLWPNADNDNETGGLLNRWIDLLNFPSCYCFRSVPSLRSRRATQASRPAAPRLCIACLCLSSFHVLDKALVALWFTLLFDDCCSLLT